MRVETRAKLGCTLQKQDSLNVKPTANAKVPPPNSTHLCFHLSSASVPHAPPPTSHDNNQHLSVVILQLILN
jgi:hypothetical protein